MEIGTIETWDDVNNALDKLNALMGVATRFEQVQMLRAIRQAAQGLPPGGRYAQEDKDEAIDIMTWAIEAVTAEVGS